MSVLKVNNAQIGQSLTSTNNFTWYQPSSPDGTVRLGVGNAGATSLDALVINSSGALTLQGTANGVAYLNGSKVLTTGSALTFDGTNLGVGGSPVSGYKAAVNGDYWQGNGGGVVIGSLINNAGWYELGGSANVNGLQFNHVNTQRWMINSSEQMRLTSTGLGIGTSSPGSKLTVAGGDIQINGGRSILLGDSTNTYFPYIKNSGSGSIAFSNPASSAVNMLLDSSGNLGLGVTPSAFSGVKALQLPADGMFGTQGVGGTYLLNNAYYNSGFKYSATGVASYYQQGSGAHQWFTAPSGTAGNAITFTQAMTLDASGNLLVGTTSQIGSGYRVSVAPISSNGGGIAFRNFDTAGGVPYVFFNSSNSVVGSIYSSNTATAYNTSSDYRLKENIQPMQNALATVAQLNPVTYTWKADGSEGQGFIAHELQAVVPDCVTGEKDAVDEEGKPVYQGVDTSFLVGILTKAIQEQQELINQLTARVAQLEK